MTIKQLQVTNTKPLSVPLKKDRNLSSSYTTLDGRFYVWRQEDGYWSWGQFTSSGDRECFDGNDYYRKYEAVEALANHLALEKEDEDLWNS